MVDSNDDDKPWQKCARRLMLNRISDVDRVLTNCEKVIQNIILHPTEPKYRTIRCGNASFRSNVLDLPGGAEVLQAAGFEWSVNTEGEKIVVFGREGGEVHLTDALLWLRSTVDTCKRFAKAKSALDGDICADCVVQVRLPTGTTVSGGFMRGDLLQDVRDFAACYFNSIRSVKNYTYCLQKVSRP